jgi:hypothetical protein
MTPEQLIEKFQCPGCVVGMSTNCGKFNLDNAYGYCCKAHVLGTSFGIGNNFAPGLPKGFCKPGPDDKREKSKNIMSIRLWISGTAPDWDHLNVPVWALEEDDFLFVRTYCPRINDAYVDVIEKGTIGMVPKAINVSKFIDEID